MVDDDKDEVIAVEYYPFLLKQAGFYFRIFCNDCSKYLDIDETVTHSIKLNNHNRVFVQVQKDSTYKRVESEVV